MAGSTYDGIKLTGSWTSPDDTSEHRLEFSSVSRPRLAAMRARSAPDQFILVTRDQVRAICSGLTSGQLDEVFRQSG